MKNPPTNKSLGQHWLDDELSLQAMLIAGAVGQTDTVLEVGPGPGALTKLLVQEAERVVAVEFDQALAKALPGRVPAANLTVINQDILKFDVTELAPGYKVVANIPYYLTSNLIRVLSETPNPPAQIALLIQKEVAERLAAQPGQLSILGVTAQFYWEIELGPVVAAELFTPPPKVDSQIVRLVRRADPVTAVGGEADFNIQRYFRLVKAGFGAKRKTLLNSLSAGLHLSKPQTQSLIAAAGIDSGLRAQNLALSDWTKLYGQFKQTLT